MILFNILCWFLMKFSTIHKLKKYCQDNSINTIIYLYLSLWRIRGHLDVVLFLCKEVFWANEFARWLQNGREHWILSFGIFYEQRIYFFILKWSFITKSKLSRHLKLDFKLKNVNFHLLKFYIAWNIILDKHKNFKNFEYWATLDSKELGLNHSEILFFSK